MCNCNRRTAVTPSSFGVKVARAEPMRGVAVPEFSPFRLNPVYLPEPGHRPAQSVAARVENYQETIPDAPKHPFARSQSQLFTLDIPLISSGYFAPALRPTNVVARGPKQVVPFPSFGLDGINDNF